MRITAVKSVRTLKHLLLFALYIAALWAVAWYDLHYYSGAYNTIVTDLLLTAAFVLAFFLPLITPKRGKGKPAALSVVGLCAAAVLALFLLQPHYTVADGCRILTDAHYQHVQLIHDTLHSTPAHAGILFEAEQNAQLHEIWFDPASGAYAAIT